MAENDNIIFPVGDNRENLTIRKINKNGTIGEMIETINANFQDIAKHGGGPAGRDGINGLDGVDGVNVEYIYCLGDEMIEDVNYPSTDREKGILFEKLQSQEKTKYTGAGDIQTFWYNHAQPISIDQKNEYVMARYRLSEYNWAYTDPVLWAHWGETGKDGDGVEYIFLQSAYEIKDQDTLDSLIIKKEHMNEYQKVIYSLDDFYPGETWFGDLTNKQRARTAFTNAGISMNEGGFNTLWEQRFGFFDGTNISNKWTDNPKGTGFIDNGDGTKELIKFEYVSIRRSYRDENDKKVWSDYSVPAIWSNYSLPTATVMIYYYADEDQTPTNPDNILVGPADGAGWYDWTNGELEFEGKAHGVTPAIAIPSGWKSHPDDSGSDVDDNKIVWMCYGIFDHEGYNQDWSSPVRLTGEPGKAGEDGTFIEFIYALPPREDDGVIAKPDNEEEREILFNNVEANGYYDQPEGNITTRWYDRAQPISYEKPIEYTWVRRKSNGQDWEYDPQPVIWSRWGEDGMDGDGVEYIFVTTNVNSPEGLTLPKYSNLNAYQKKLFQINDFIPSANWFVEKNKQKAIDAIGAGSFSNADWENKYGFGSYSEWTDNPASVDAEHKYQWVSIRRSENNSAGKAVWQDFGEPKLWSKYSTSIFTAYAFIATKAHDDLSNYQPHGLVSFSDPRPVNDTYQGKQIVWTDGPITSIDKPVVWVTSAKVNEDQLSTINWSKPIKMADTAEFNVEWSSTDIMGDELADLIEALGSSEYNFGVFLAANNNIESDAEEAWRNYVQSHLGVEFSDSTENAFLMATCQYTSGTWSNWELVRVKGEAGEDGRPLNVVGRIQHEMKLPAGTTYTYANVSSFFNSAEKPSANNGDLLIVYPAEINSNKIYYGDETNDKGGALYMWMYLNNNWIDYNSSSNGVETYNTYASPNRHLILWDGDSWQDMGEFKGDTGDRYIVLVKYANDVNGVKTYVSNADIPNAKWIGILTIIEGSEDTNAILATDPRWTWSLFKGQDGFGYEYIFKRTNSYSAPSVPSTTSEQDLTDEFYPSGWSDEPMEPTADNRYVWMCWRKYDKNNGVWSKFMGEQNKTAEQSGLAKRWNMFTNGITGVVEYFHADTTNSPSDAAYTGDPTDYPNYWFSSSSAAGWGLNKKYLFNVEVVEYLDGSAQIMDPHFVTMYEDGIKDVTDYYCLDSDGETAPAMSGGVPVITGSSSTEGKSWWTTNAKKTPIGREYEYLWNVSRKTYEGGKADVWTTPVVIGVYTEGSSTIYADLDNEMDSVQIEANTRKVITAGTYTSTLSMYYGNEKLKITRCDVSGEEPFRNKISFSTIPTGGTENVTMTLNLAQGDVLPEISHKIVFTVTAKTPTGSVGNVDEVSRIVTYTLIGTTHEYVYSININPNSIIKPTSGAVNPSTLSISVVERNGVNTTTHTSPNSRFDVYVSKNGGTKTKLTSFSYSTSGLNIDDRITFTVESSVNGTNTVLDTETIYVLREGTDGAAGNGYQYCYVRYTNADESKYGGATTPTVTQAYTTSNPTFKIGNETVTSTSTPQGADAAHTYEYRSERSGYNGNWSKWSTPVTIAKYLDTGNIEATISREVNNAISSAESRINANISSVNSRVSTISSYIDSIDGYISESGVFSGTISSGTMTGIVTAVTSSSSFTSSVTTQLNGIVADISGVSTFSDWVNNETSEIRSANQRITSMASGMTQIENNVTAVSQGVATNAANILTVTSNYAEISNVVTTMSNTVAGIKQTVDAGVAAVDIFVNKDDHSAGMVFQATGSGSEIALRADRVGIQSNYFNLDSNGIRFNSKSGQTSLGIDGILRAENAVISGNIKAQEFEANMQTSISTSATVDGTQKTITGTANKVTLIDGQSLTITATGTVNVGSDTKNINNSLYIKLVDVLDNPNTSEFNSDKLICVPVLCMNYEGKEYMLSPASWMTNNVIADTSNAKWMSIGTYYTYSFSAPSSSTKYCVTGISSQAGCTYYVAQSGNLVSNFGSVGLYRMTILDWGTQEANFKQSFIDRGLLDSTGTIGTITTRGRIGDAAYIGSSTQAKITQTLINTYGGTGSASGYKLTSSEDFMEYISVPNITDVSTYGLQNMIDYLNSRVDQDKHGNDIVWSSHYEGMPGQATLDNNSLKVILPYTDQASSSDYSDTCSLNLSVGYLHTLSSPYFHFNSTIKEIYCRYSLDVTRIIDNNSMNYPVYMTAYNNPNNGLYTYPGWIRERFTFDFILRPTSTLTDYSSILPKVKTFLENIEPRALFAGYVSGKVSIGEFNIWISEDDGQVHSGPEIACITGQTEEPE